MSQLTLIEMRPINAFTTYHRVPLIPTDASGNTIHYVTLYEKDSNIHSLIRNRSGVQLQKPRIVNGKPGLGSVIGNKHVGLLASSLLLLAVRRDFVIDGLPEPLRTPVLKLGKNRFNHKPTMADSIAYNLKHRDQSLKAP